ncbi:MAG: hypothetical protein ABSC37_07210 [Xanthobacteraceae bacterium]
MSDNTSQNVALGWFDPKRMEETCNLVKTFVGIEKPFDITQAYTNAFLDKSIKMKAVPFTDYSFAAVASTSIRNAGRASACTTTIVVAGRISPRNRSRTFA